MNPFEKLILELKRLKVGYREESYYRPLEDFLEDYASAKEYLHMLDIKATNNPGSESVGEGVGFPDIEVRGHRNKLIGYVEVKSPTENLDDISFSIQFNRYKESLENIVFTNFKKWVLYSWDSEGKSQKAAEAEWDLKTLEAKDLKKLLTIFFEGQSYQAKTPKQLALALARKTKLLSQQVQEALIKERPEKRLVDLKNAFEKTLIQDISDHQFSNIYAETIAYSLFLAMLQHYEKGSSREFTLRTAVDYLPKSVPVFKELYQLTGGAIDPVTPEIQKATEILIDQLKYADIEKIYKKLVEHSLREDPVIQFYEPFLAEYDPKEREARGVYYTPKPVVDYIVRSVDFILKTKFDKQKGLGDQSVQILDPATGTGTFLMSAIQNIHSDIEKEYMPLGGDLVKRKFNDIVSKHILKHLYGFELLVAPYAIAHLKLTLELERLGFDFTMTESDEDKNNDRLKIYLANTLDDPEKPPITLFGYQSIAEESEQARIIKREAPILAIVGNPPYSGVSMNMQPSMRVLVERYKYIDGIKIKERGALQMEKNLNDDYVKFVSFAQSKIEKNGLGIVAYITNNGYLDNPTLPGLRKELLNSFDELYIFNLYGSKKKSDHDDSVFNISIGTAICFLIKYSDSRPKKIFYKGLKGSKSDKFEYLSTHDINSTDWERIVPKQDRYLFIKTDEKNEKEYLGYLSLKKIFKNSSIGLITARDNLVIQFTKSEVMSGLRKWENCLNLDAKSLCEKLEISEKKGWDIVKAKRDYGTIQADKEKCIREITYKPFDTRWIFYHRSLVWSMSFPTMKHLLKERNLVLLFPRQAGGDQLPLFVGRNIFTGRSVASVASITYGAPLFLENEEDTLFNAGPIPNIDEAVGRNIADKIGLSYSPAGGDKKNKIGPLEIFYYCYATLHSPSFRKRYSDQLKLDYPRVPITSNSELFKQLGELGNQLVNLHLLGKNPFDKSKTIFDDTSKWNTKLGGEKPKDLEDWKVAEVRFDEKSKRVYVNSGQYFEGIEKEVWDFMIGGYQVLYKWLNDRKKTGRTLSYDDQIHYMKVIVSLRETIRIMKDIDQAIPNWPIK